MISPYNPTVLFSDIDEGYQQKDILFTCKQGTQVLNYIAQFWTVKNQGKTVKKKWQTTPPPFTIPTNKNLRFSKRTCIFSICIANICM
jgi:hypothetical protein